MKCCNYQINDNVYWLGNITHIGYWNIGNSSYGATLKFRWLLELQGFNIWVISLLATLSTCVILTAQRSTLVLPHTEIIL